MKTIRNQAILLSFVSLIIFFIPTAATASPTISTISSPQSGSTYTKFEVAFQIQNSKADNNFFPYDPNPPSGLESSLPNRKGITVDAIFSQDNFATSFKVPAFYMKEYQTRDSSGNLILKNGIPWFYPTGQFKWVARFSPNKAGNWQYKLTATDAGGTTTSGVNSFSVTNSNKKGFVKVSKKDPRYFEFSNGSPFLYQGIEFNSSLEKYTSDFAKLKNDGIHFVRWWWSGIYGSAWSEWTAGNAYGGYLPRSMLEPIKETSTNRQLMTTRLEYPNGGWYDGCIVGGTNDKQALLQNKTYRFSVSYVASNITGPRVAGKPYGVVGKLDNGGNSWQCWDSGTGSLVTNYGGNSSTLTTISGTFNSGSNNFLPRILVGLENVNQGTAYVYTMSVREDLGNGQLGPEILMQPSSEYFLYPAEFRALESDIILEEAEKNDLYLKIVTMDKDDDMWKKINNDGSLVINQPENDSGFYGSGRSVNATRWLEMAWFRYMQARWGYSTSVHSFELLNEGDPGNGDHFALTDEMGKMFRCRAFGITIPYTAGSVCNYEHPNAHMTTTSFWHSFPATNFWENASYPNTSYADIHAYNSTSSMTSTECNKSISETDSAYYHLCHSINLEGWKIGKPIVRGEAGMDPAASQCDTCLGIQNDTSGTWLHTFLWSTLDQGALYELYWWYTEHINMGTIDHSAMYKTLTNFTETLPLNSGTYQAVAAELSNSNIEVVGQKDPVNGNAHFWVRNKSYTWKNQNPGGQSGTIKVTGFQSGKQFTIQEWDTFAGSIKSTNSVAADSSGAVTVSVSNLSKDTAFKIINPTAATPTPTPSTSVPTITPTSPPSCSLKATGDADCSGKVDLTDFEIWRKEFTGSLNTKTADFNMTSTVDLADFEIWRKTFMK